MSDFASTAHSLEAAQFAQQFVPPELAIVVPTFNEYDNVGLLYESLSAALEGISWELIVVDDNSPDHTAERVKALSRQHGNVRCIRRLGRRGLSSACIEGIMATAAPFVAVMDADHQHDERILPGMLARAEAGIDLVVGSRFVGGDESAAKGLSSTRLWGSNFATRLSGMVVGGRLTDPMSGFFLMRREAFERVAQSLAEDGFKILLDLVVTSGRSGEPLSIAEVPYTFRARNAGESKMSALVTLQFLGLWFSKLTGGVVPPTFLLFAMVGISGVAVHLVTLWLFTNIDTPFVAAQIIATLAAMTWNFALNNVLTYADRRLRGARLWTGLLGFYLVCSLGGIANISVASVIYEYRGATFLAGLAGAVMSSVFNYAVTRIVTWRS
ncbi:MAG TPA: glycosyltransferase family 2 protein [Devosiaceae bacterium]|jgi:dolichol-phosphate mannosyltransferase